MAYRAVPLKHGPEEVIVFSTSVADRVMFGVFGAETLLAVQDWPVAECADAFAWVAATLAACSVELPDGGSAACVHKHGRSRRGGVRRSRAPTRSGLFGGLFSPFFLLAFALLRFVARFLATFGRGGWIGPHV